MSEKGKMDAGRWKKPENLSRYVRGIVVRDGAMARLLAAREAEREAGEREEGPETGPADLSGEM